MDVLEPSFWASEWQQARERSSLYRSQRNDASTRPHGEDSSCPKDGEGVAGGHRRKRWMQYWNHVADSYARRNEEGAAYHGELVSWLERESVIDRSSTVLDVGCGPGTYALHFARRVRQVIALDSAPAMLSLLERLATQTGLERRIQTLLCPWEDFESSVRYDLVFAANSPAVWNQATLLKMNELCSAYCCLVTSSRASRLGLRDQLWKRVTGEKIRGGAFDPIYPFNLLYAMGYHPQVKFTHFIVRYRERLETLLDDYIRYFAIFGYEGPETEAAIRDYLISVSRDGYCEDVWDEHLALIWWKAQKEPS